MEKVLTTYENAVHRLAFAKENFPFQNRDNNHASIVTSALLEYSKEVRFFIKNLDGSIADIPESSGKEPRFINSLQEFLSIGKSIKIVVEESFDASKEPASAFYQFLKNAILNLNYSTLEVRHASKEFITHQKDGLTITGEYRDFYYMVGDKSSYRINFDREKHQALCNFNDESLASVLVANFDHYFESCKPFFQ